MFESHYKGGKQQGWINRLIIGYHCQRPRCCHTGGCRLVFVGLESRLPVVGGDDNLNHLSLKGTNVLVSRFLKCLSRKDSIQSKKTCSLFLLILLGFIVLFSKQKGLLIVSKGKFEVRDIFSSSYCTFYCCVTKHSVTIDAHAVLNIHR